MPAEFNVRRFDSFRRIEGMWPDTDVPGWMTCQLECGHLTWQPTQNTNRICHCGQCVLDHQAHLQKMAQLAKAQELAAYRNIDFGGSRG